MIPCHCIIAHPEAAKFLVIKHSEGWSPPQLKVPGDGTLMYKPAIINHGMMRKYGFRTTVLRHILSSSTYHCIELELHASSQRNMQAVWMGRENYTQFSRQDSAGDDPFERWLEERESGTVSPLRSPWEQPGWYREAEQWMTEKLVGQGIQATGSVQQFKAGWPVSCLLRVATSEGQVYFKAAYDKPPGEARITSALAGRWPEIVPKPMATDEDRNWMLFSDFAMKKQNRVPAERYPEFGRVLGRMQVESMDEQQTWRELGCPLMDLDFMAERAGRAEGLIKDSEPLLTSGRDALDETEMEGLRASIAEAREVCAQLGEFGIPSALSHLDFRPDNWFVEDKACRVFDWADAALTHPFMAICHTLEFFRAYGTGEPGREDAALIDDASLAALREEYLSAFSAYGSSEALGEALEQAIRVFPLFRLLAVAFEMQHLEPQGPHDRVMRNLLKQQARSLVSSMGQ